MSSAKNEAKVTFIAETSEFTAGIKQCNSDLAGMRSELKLNSTQMEGAGRTTELLTQRQELLSSELETAREKVALTSDTLEAAKRIYGEDSEEVQKYARQLTEAKNQEQAIQNALDATTRELEEQKDQWEQLGQTISAAGDTVQGVGNKITSAGKKLSVLSAGVAAIGAASYAAWKDVDEAYDTIVTKTGAAGDALEGLQDSFDAVFGAIPVEAADAGIAIGEVNTRFQATGEVLEDLSALFLEFAQINDADVNSSIDSVDRILTKFNVDASQTGSVLGLLTKAGQDTGISMDTLLSSLDSNGAALKEMGLDLTAAINLLAQMESNGVDVSTAMTGLKKAVTNAAAGGKSMDQALSETIDTIKNAETATEALTAAQELFGTKGAAEMAQAIREGRLSVEDLTLALGDYSTVVEDTFNATLDPVDQVDVALNNLKLTGADLFESIETAALPLIDGLSAGIQTLSGWFSGLTDGQRQAIIVIGAVVAVAGPLVVIIGQLITSAGTIISFVGAVIPLLGAAAGAIGAISAPVLIVIGVIGALIAVGVLLYQHWDAICEKASWLKDKVVDVWTGIKTGVSNAVSGVVSTVTAKFEAVKYAVTHPIETAQNLVQGYIDRIKGFFDIVLKFSGIKLPHISISWSTSGIVAKAAQLLGLQGVPKFSVEWYARGGVFSRPTLLAGTNGLSGVGEAGPEAVAPISVLQGYVSTAVEAAIGGAKLERLISLVEVIAAKDPNLYVDGQKFAQASAGSFDAVNGRRMNLQSRGVVL